MKHKCKTYVKPRKKLNLVVLNLYVRVYDVV